MRALSYLLIFAFWGVYQSEGAILNGTVYFLNGGVVFRPGVMDSNAGVAYGVFNDSIYQSGWGVLDIKAGYASQDHEDQLLMYAAGYLESALTQQHIYNQYLNVKQSLGLSDEVTIKIQKYFNDQEAWKRDMIRKAPPTDAYWRHMAYITQQFQGLVDGYAEFSTTEKKLELFAFQLLNGAGDSIDLSHALGDRPDPLKMSVPELKQFILNTTHCSALFKALPGYEDIFMSHSSWFTYASTNRIFKYYDFKLRDPATKATTIAFSSYPGYLNSLDDFYLMSNGMVMIQTTNNVFNMSLYDLVTPESNLAWYRVRVAHMMSKGGKEWADVLKRYNSGTYNNQYMLLDLDKVVLKEDIHDDAFWVVEQIPGLVEAADVTDILRRSFWSSYNVPFFEEIYDRSGYPAVVQAKGEDFSYDLAPRAKIFRRDAGKVTDLETMKAIMRYNDYKRDPYSEENACDSICCRGDLVTKTPSATGCYDTKVSNYGMARDLKASIINGPTQGTGLGPFSWSKSQFNSSSHLGLPDVYNFPFMNVTRLLH